VAGGSIARWLSDVVGRTGRVSATDLETGFLSEIRDSNVEVLRHDIRTDGFSASSFDLIHTRAVLMHIFIGVNLLRRVVSWLTPGGWLLVEELDFGMWMGDADPIWARSPETTPELATSPSSEAASERYAASAALRGKPWMILNCSSTLLITRNGQDFESPRSG
jgi:hypothetical protein